MKVVVAVDSFKGSMTSMEAGMAVKAGILAAKKDAEVIVKPLADGGEGTTDALIEGLKGERVDVTVTGPYHEPVQAYYGYLRESNTAVMEMATAAGITLSDKKEPMTATTYGVGELILHAIGRGIRNFIIGIGGSATNDGGVGMLRAFGYKFLDEKGEDVGEGGQALARIASVEISDKKELLSQCNFRIACDVTNPLCGSQGATYIYGPQKGVTPDILPVLDAGMKNYAEVTAKVIGKDNQNAAGAGAAGGLGFAFLNYLDGELTPGIQLILDAVHVEEEMKDADEVVTGEGCLDYQTAMGKAPVGVAKLGKKNLANGVKVEITDGNVVVDVSLEVEYGTSIKKVSEGVQEKVKQAIENMTGLHVRVVNVVVSGIKMNKE